MKNQIKNVKSFEELISTPFLGKINAMCWTRNLTGDFSEIVKKTETNENIAELKTEKLLNLQLSKQGNFARETLLNDLKILKENGALPTLNIIKNYDRDDGDSFFPTDVYSFHVDSSPVPTNTFLCTYHGEPSDILPNSQAIQKILIPEIRNKLKEIYNGTDDGFDAFLAEYFFNLHYQAKSDAKPISLGLGHMWKLAIDHPNNPVLPCIHRAPKEKKGETRLMIIC